MAAKSKPTKPTTSGSGLLNDCDECYKQDISQCLDELVFVLGLKEGEMYFVTFTDSHGREHVIEAVADIDGNITIAATQLPVGFFIVYGGTKTVTIKQATCENICFELCNKLSGDVEGDGSGIEIAPTPAPIFIESYCCIILRPVDRVAEAGIITEVVPCCEELPDTERINFLTLDFKCVGDKGAAEVSGTFTVTNGIGPYSPQIYFMGVWQSAPDLVTPPSFAIALGSGDQPPVGSYAFRIIDTTTLMISNELELVVKDCSLFKIH